MSPHADSLRQPLIRLPLKSYHNVRDIGGYAGYDGKAVRFGRFFRASEPCGIDPADIQTLIDLPVHTFIDLRSDAEVDYRPSSFHNLPNVRSYHFSLLRPRPAAASGEDLFSYLSAFTLGEVYIHMQIGRASCRERV